MIFNLKDKQILSRLIAELNSLPMNKYSVTIKEKKRSLDQNALYHVWIGYLSKDLGYTKKELHESFKEHYLGIEMQTSIFGKVYPVLKSTRDLTKEEFTLFLDKVQIFAAESGTILPTKRDYGW